MIAKITNELMIEHERQKAMQQAAARKIDYDPDVDLEDTEVGNMILYWLRSGRIKVKF